MTWIKKYDHINCDECQKEIQEGDFAYDLKGIQVVCETCYDKWLEQVKEDSKIEVNENNFDLEEEEYGP